jgi:hypothetical protein
VPGIADIADLAAAFPQRSIPAATIDLYARELADLDPVALSDAVRLLIRTSEFFPTIRAIREAVAEAALGLPNEAEALNQIHERSGVHPLVREAVNVVGGWHAVRTTDQPGVLRGQFLRVYRELRHARVGAYIAGDAAALPPVAPMRELHA